MYSTHIEGKSIVPEINIRTLKNIWLMNLQIYDLHIKKNVYIDISDDAVNK